LALESRSIGEFTAFLAMSPYLGLVRRGDRHPVLIFPGFGGSDQSTAPMRRALRRLGYRAHGWRLGPNRGSTSETIERAGRRLDELHQRLGATVSVLGHSAGGLLARELARAAPGSVRQVITVGSPFRFRRGDRSHATVIAEFVMDPNIPRPLSSLPREEGRPPLPVPTTAIYSRTDGVVDWRACIEAEGQFRENIEVRGSHAGLIHNAAVLIAVADRLALPEGGWRPFRAALPVRGLYPRPESWHPTIVHEASVEPRS